MTDVQHLTHFGDLSVVDWEPYIDVLDPSVCYRITLGWHESQAGTRWTDTFANFLRTSGSAQVAGISVGPWDFTFQPERDSGWVVEALVTARPRLPNLRVVFLGDISQEQSEISWIQQSDLAPLLAAYPALQHLGVRGGAGLSFGQIDLPQLKTLVIQTGGMDVRVLRQVAGARLPKLEHLELWLGETRYGWNGTLDEVIPLLDQDRFPRLRYLGLRDSEIGDGLAAAVARSPLLDHLAVLDLSLGTLGDQGAEALLASPSIRQLKKLDLRHHYCSESIIARLRALGIDVDLSEGLPPTEDRYVAVGE